MVLAGSTPASVTLFMESKMKTQTLLEAVCNQYQEWPCETIEYFNCDFDGEVRERGSVDPVGRNGTEYDFYPEIDVVKHHRNVFCGPDSVCSVTKAQFLKEKGL